jgi:hypothetical protein
MLLDQTLVEYAAVGRAAKTWDEGQKHPPAYDTGKYSGAFQRAYGYKAAAEAFCESAELVSQQMRELGREAQTDIVRSLASRLPNLDCKLSLDLRLEAMSSSLDVASKIQLELTTRRNNALDGQAPLLDACSSQLGVKPGSPPFYKIITLIDD